MTNLEFIKLCKTAKTEEQLDKFCQKHILIWYEDNKLNLEIKNIRLALINKKLGICVKKNANL
ncbi:MAG: hypothetical protein WC123_03545 [Bacilli bacterium]